MGLVMKAWMLDRGVESGQMSVDQVGELITNVSPEKWLVVLTGLVIVGKTVVVAGGPPVTTQAGQRLANHTLVVLPKQQGVRTAETLVTLMTVLAILGCLPWMKRLLAVLLPGVMK